MYSSKFHRKEIPFTTAKLWWTVVFLYLALLVGQPGRSVAGPYVEPVRLGDEEKFIVKDYRHEADVDNDGITDHEDLDLDNDGIFDYADLSYDLLIEQDDDSVQFNGHWTRDSFPYYSNGTARSSIFEGNICEVTFRGEYISWIGSVGPGMGYAHIYIDNTFTVSVDLYRENYELEEVAYRSRWLDTGVHTLRIEVGKRSGESNVYPVEVDAFRVVTDAPSRKDFYQEVTARCERISWYAYFFVDEEESISDDDLDNLVEAFDQAIYPTITDKFGPLPVPGIDSIEKLFILLTDIKDGYNGETEFEYVPGYFSRMDQFIPVTFPFSNKKDLLVLDVNPTSFDSGEVKKSLAKQFHWFIHWYAKSNGHPVSDYDDYWVRNGLGLLSGYLSGLGHPYQMEFFRKYPDSELVVEDERYSTDANEGASYLFFLYIWERYGTNFLQGMTATSTTGLDAVIEQLESFGTTFRDTFSDWVMANYLDDPTENNWGYRYADFQVVPTAEHTTFALDTTNNVLPLTAAHYIKLTGVDRQDLMLKFVGNTINWFLLRAVYLNNDGTASVEEITLDSLQKLDHTLGGFSQTYRTVILVLSNRPPYEEDGLPWGDGVYSYNIEKFGPVATGFFNPIFPNTIIITMEAGPRPQVKAYQTGMEFFDLPKVNTVSDHLFSAFYSIKPEYTGPGKIVVTGIGLDGRDGGVQLDFVTGRVTGGQRLDVTSGDIKLGVPENTLPDGTSLVLLPTAAPDGQGELRPVSQTIAISPGAAPLKRSASLLIPGMSSDAGGISQTQVALFRQQDNTWIFETAATVAAKGIFRSEITRFGRFAVMADTTPPRVWINGVQYTEEGMIISVHLTDGGAGVSSGGVVAKTSAGDEVTMTVSGGIATALVETNASHTVRWVAVTAADRTGNQTTSTLQVAPPVAGVSLVMYPNPASGAIQMRCTLTGANWTGTDTEAYVYDLAGDMVMQFGLNDFVQTAPGVISAAWDLENEQGRSVANGTYFCKVRLGTSRGQLEAKSTLAVIR